MKLINWTKIPPRQIQGTIWNEIEAKNSQSNSQQLEFINFEEIEDLFSTQIESKKEERTEKNKKKENVAINLVDSKKAQNLGIILNRLKSNSNYEIMESILKVEDLLDTVALTQFWKFCPSAEDYETIDSFLQKAKEEGDKVYEETRNNLGAVEKFFLSVRNIPRLKERLGCMNIKANLPMKILELKKDAKILGRASSEILQSQSIPSLLNIVLQLGNFVNGGTFRGSASGFKMEILPKLVELKSIKNSSMTFMNYMRGFIDSKYPNTCKFVAEIPSIFQASKISFSALNADLKQAKEDISSIETELKWVLENESKLDSEDRFEEAFSQFYVTTKEDLDETLIIMEESNIKYTELLKKFGEESSVLPEEFFGIWEKFATAFERARMELERERMREERANKAAALRVLKEMEKENSKKKNETGDRGEDDELEDIIVEEEEEGGIMEKLRGQGIRVMRDS
eukprot:TRINITY_DN7527_c0_g1_i4.p1 TRINITY_DN7527_c0_g1~~TRINITY_DN7527_c0_g1_i4.p1  ORF type:complete len:458 (-),score=206.71 TRINITY_DN7527_c0_g1_i4:172-1545(-)